MKRSRRKLRITREGWSFIFILCFIIVGSVLQQINLLVMLAGLMIAPLLLNWRIAMNSIFQLEMKRRLPDWAHAGQTVNVEWQVTNQRRLLPAWGVKITDSIRRNDVPVAKSTRVEPVLAQVNPKQVAYASYRCHFGQRGSYVFGPAEISSRFPLGLARASYLEYESSTLTVAPRLGALTDKWNRKIVSVVFGSRSSIRKRGTTQDDFYALREWRAGDSRRWIHWRTSAKYGQPIVKQFDQQTDRDFAMVLDVCQAAQHTSSDMEKVELAVSFLATALSNVRSNVEGKISIGLCGKTSSIHTERINQEFLRAVMCELAEIQPAPENDLSSCLQEMSRNMSDSAPIIVISTRSQDAALEAADPNLAGGRREIANATWIEAGSPEFHQLFKLAPQSNIDQIIHSFSNNNEDARPAQFSNALVSQD